MQTLKPHPKSKNFFERIYKIVRQIPTGRVLTYGQIALRLRSGPSASRIYISARTVGWALHANKNPKVPCHRVVNKDGRLAPGYAFGGPNEQKNKLISEGIEFISEANVNLHKHLWNGYKS